MDQAKCLELIALYKQHSILWNTKDKLYHNKNRRQDAWCEISSIMSIPIPELKAKMKTLMGTFRSEKSKEKKSNITGLGSQNVYTSKWFAFKSFEFLMDRDQPRGSVNTDMIQAAEASIPTPQGENVDLSSFPTSEPTDENTTNATETIERQTTANFKKAASKRKREPDGDDKLMMEAFQLLKSSADVSKDPYYAYGMHIASELRKFDKKTQACIKKGIADLFFQAEMGSFNSAYNPVATSMPNVYVSPSPQHSSTSATSTPSWPWLEENNNADSYTNL